MDIFKTNTNSYCDSIKVSNYEQDSINKFTFIISLNF